MGQIKDIDMEENSEKKSDVGEVEPPKINPKKRKGSYKEKLLLMKKQKLLSGEDNVLAEAQEPVQKENKPNYALYKQPTADELNQLRETENLFNSNIFRLQIDELLGEIKVKPKYEKLYDSWFETFKESFKTITELDTIPLVNFKNVKGKKLSAQQKFINQTVKDLNHELFSKPHDLSMKFNKPVSVTRMAKYNCISSKELKYNPSICLAMPKETFSPKSDFLYNNYAIKKYHYMVYVMQHIKSLDIVKEVKIENYFGNYWMPILTIVPSNSEKITINLFVVPEENTFKIKRFLPHNNNIKKNILTDMFEDVKVEDFTNEGTYLHNSIIAHDTGLLLNNSTIEENLRGLQNIQDGIKLLMVWLKQRKLNETYAGFTDDLLVYLIVYLILKKKITKHMSSYQVIRIFWFFLSSTQNLLSIANTVKLEDLSNFKEFSHFVLVDATGCLNVAAFLDSEVFIKVKNEAALAVKNLDNNRFNTFTTLFISKITFAIQYDALLKIKDDSNFSSVFDGCDTTNRFKYFGFYEMLIRKRVMDNLKMGLSNRVLEIVPILAESTMDKLVFGINLNPETCLDVVVKGPKQFDADAAKFKEFWGPLAELRRFKDTSIYEAVYFDDAKTIQDKRHIFKKIIKYVLKEKMGLKYTLNGDEMEKILKIDNIVAPFPSGSNEEATLKIKAIHYDMSKMLRDLALPLPVTAIQGLSNVYSYTMCYPPIPTNTTFNKYNVESTKESHSLLLGDLLNAKHLPNYIEPVECVIELGMHSKWPRELEPMRAMKMLFLFEMSDLLWKEKHVRSAVREECCIDIFYEGLVFRLWLHHPKEIGYLMRNVSADGVVYFKDSRDSLHVESKFKVLPKIIGALNGIHQESPSFGPSTCLIKRWIRAQMLDESHIPDVVIDLLNASLYLTPEPFSVPTLPQVGFIRFLKFISEFDFNMQPVVVNFNDNLTNEQLYEMDGNFQNNRADFRDLHIITPYDEGTSIFTRESPNKDIIRVLQLLAQATYKHLTDCIISQDSFKFKSVLVPNISEYNLIIHLDAKCVLKYLQKIDCTSTNVIKIEEYKHDARTKIPVVGFDPIQIYLKELRKNYGDFALFFYDSYGGYKIGVLWRKKSLEENDFKILNVPARQIKDGKLQLNIAALIEDFKCLGTHCVKSVQKIN
ncbi:PREDICTED: nucleolar protein 6 [Nicrophorus vespilloides]|uniref:Nucleolar protein 6 n=1 Tax=Nicrophorus vespilloides TaxID=110193 RepID=A0ABM1MSD5_NICVS|nr:PREDICTED: nucleolar protein 6 [Nicrophorus vespilloides]